MTKKQARKAILEFMEKYKGKKVYFVSLTDEEKYVYVLTKSSNYFMKFLNSSTTLDRAIRNADAHKKDGYKTYIADYMIVA